MVWSTFVSLQVPIRATAILLDHRVRCCDGICLRFYRECRRVGLPRQLHFGEESCCVVTLVPFVALVQRIGGHREEKLVPGLVVRPDQSSPLLLCLRGQARQGNATTSAIVGWVSQQPAGSCNLKRVSNAMQRAYVVVDLARRSPQCQLVASVRRKLVLVFYARTSRMCSRSRS